MSTLQILLVLMTMHFIDSGPPPCTGIKCGIMGRGLRPDQAKKAEFLDDFLILDDFEKYAEKYMEKKRLSYIQSGAMLEHTLKENTAAFLRIQLLPKLLHNTLKINLSTTILNRRVALPIGICPNAIQQVEHPDAEKATARAAEAEGAVMILSVHSSLSLEEVAASAPTANLWFQVLNFNNHSITEDLVRRARRAGFKAIVLTIDYPVVGLRITYERTKFTDNNYTYGNFEKYKSSINFQESVQPDPTTGWRIIHKLKDISRLPLVVKGILTAEDAKLAVESGADAIIVSNHGGRQLDGVPATIEVLPEVVRAVNGRVEVYLDSGVRTGTDVVKALALGARAVFIGRPNLYGLFAAGQHGSRKVLQLLANELENAMRLTGVTQTSDLNSSFVRTECCRTSRH